MQVIRRPRPPGWMEKPTGLAAWKALHARLIELNRVLYKGADRVQILRNTILEQASKLLNGPRTSQSQNEEAQFLEQLMELLTVLPIDGGKLSVQLQLLRPLLGRIERSILARARDRYRDWISNSLKTGAGALHRYAKEYGQPKANLADAFTVDGELILDARKAVAAKAAFWGGLWQAEQSPPPEAPGGPSSGGERASKTWPRSRWRTSERHWGASDVAWGRARMARIRGGGRRSHPRASRSLATS